MFAEFPWRVRIEDWDARVYDVGGSANHWSGRDHLLLRLSREAGQDLLGLNLMKFLDRFVSGEVGMEGNLYLLPEIRNYIKLELRPIDVIKSRLGNRVMEAPERAKRSVKSHYDIP